MCRFSIQISSVEKEGRQLIERELTSLRQQVLTTTERAHSLQVELEVAKSELKHTKVRKGYIVMGWVLLYEFASTSGKG